MRVVLAIVALVLVAGLALAIGEPVSFSRAFADASSIDHAIIFRARLPRVLLGVLAGSGLAVTGASFQALLRNPLAEPYVLGVAGGAALGATIALAIGTGGMLLPPILAAGLTAIAAALGGVMATAIVHAIAGRADGGLRFSSIDDAGRATRGNATAILLAGVVVNAIATGAITFVKTIVRASTAQQLLFWLAGFLDVPPTSSLIVVAIAVAIGSAMLIADAPRFNLLALGDEQAAHLGVDVRALERRVFIASSLVVGAIVATCGIIGFIGLLVPHVVRRLVGPDHRVLVPLSLVVGAATLVACDLAARMTFRLIGTEPPVGAITALIGGPLFLVLLTRRRSA